MISPIGSNRSAFPFLKKRSRLGFTFIEIMIASGVLACGILFIYKAFFTSLSFIDHFVTRIYADNLVHNTMIEVKQELKVKKQVPFFEKEQIQTVEIGQKKVDFNVTMSLSPLKKSETVFQLDIQIAWKENNREIRLSRQTIVTLGAEEKKE